MSIFDSAYDEMSWEEVCYRLPGDLAVQSLKRRITNLDTLLMFFASCKNQGRAVSEIRSHVNSILNNYPAADILKQFGEEYHQVLFDWTDVANRKRLKDDAKSELTIKQLFNMTDAKDSKGLDEVLERILADAEIKQSMVLSVLHKADVSAFLPLLNRVIRDKRDEVRCCVLSIGDVAKGKLVSDNMKIVGLKSWAKGKDIGLSGIDTLDFNLISSLRPAERLDVLKKYLSKFPHYRKMSVFVKDPTDEELDLTLFAGCIDQNDLVVELKDLYNKITKDDKPADE